MSEIRLSDSRSFPRVDFLSRLNDYNTYYEGRPERLQKRQTGDEDLILDGLLNIYWGLRTVIRLQVADHAEGRIRPRKLDKEKNGSMNSSEGNVTSDLNAAWSHARQRLTGPRLSIPSLDKKECMEVNDKLMRINSVVMRPKTGRHLRYRASINGHSYNQRTSIFTPAFGSVTKVRVSSLNNANDVMIKLLNKFRVENSPEDFSFYIVKETEERRELPHDEFPLLSRVMIGPNEKLGKIFLMERKMHQEISHEVAQYIKLDTSILQVVLEKFCEEEEIEVKKLEERYEFYRKMLSNRIKEAAT